MKEKLTIKEKVGYGLGDVGCAFAMTTICTYLMYFYTDVFGISVGAVGTLFLVARIWDAVNDPIIGTWIEKSNLKRGKYKPFIIYGCIPLAIFSVLCFISPDFSDMGKLIYAYITYIGAGMLYTLVNTSYSSLSSVMTEDPVDRTSLTAVRMYLANAGGIFISLGVPMLATYLGKDSLGTGYMLTAIIFATASVIMFIITHRTCKERIKITAPAENITMKSMITTMLSNKPLIMLCIIFIVTFTNNSISSAVGTYYIKYNSGREDLTGFFLMLTNIAGLFSLAIIPYFSMKIGKKSLLMAAHIISIVGLILMYIIPAANITLVFITRFIISFGTTMIMGLIWNMAPDVIDYGEYHTGNRMGGVIYAVIGFFFKLGNALAGVIPGIILSMTGYIPNVKQTATALFGIKFTMIAVPFILTLLVLIPIALYKLNNKETLRIAQELHDRRLQNNVTEAEQL